MPATFALADGLRPGGRYSEWKPAVPRYVLCDVDGTIVGGSGSVAVAVREAAAEAIASGLQVGFATGRGLVGLDHLDAVLSLPGPHVVANGAQIVHEGRAVTTAALPGEAVDGILDLGIYAEFYTSTGLWVTQWLEDARPHWDLLATEPTGVIGDDDGDADLASTAKVTLVLFGRDADHDDAVRRAVAELPAESGSSSSPATPGLEYVNITACGANKGTALRAAADALGIDVDATVAVGDERNDLPMLRVAGTGVAMGQSGDAVVAASHLVAPAVTDDGLAAVLRAVVAWQD
jgi:Cof subfamily protein (haloacid dehalogenase superfamily)